MVQKFHGLQLAPVAKNTPCLKNTQKENLKNIMDSFYNINNKPRCVLFNSLPSAT